MKYSKQIVLNIKNAFVLIILNLILIQSYSQGGDPNVLNLSNVINYPGVIPSSPNAASLGKYGDIPVSYYTGVPSINIPIFEMKSKVTTVPISLSYHASGVRMNEIPGWAGTGWSLNSGGVISRSVIGRPDDLETYGYFNNDLLPTPNEINNWYNLDSWDIPSGYKSPIFKGIWDLQPDSYSFNFLGYSGKLIITNDAFKEVYTVPYNKWDISLIEDSNNHIIGFIIITDDGTKYEFGGTGAVEMSLFNPGFCSPEIEEIDYITAWYLTKISSPKVSSDIEFTYQAVNNKEIESISESRFYTNTFNYGIGDCGGTCSDEINHPCSSTIIYSQILPDQIICDAYTVTFDNDETATGEGIYKLSSILIEDNYTNDQKFISLSYDIHGSRHFLKSVSERDKIHTFSYIHPNLLENINTFAQDYWGFYNGITANNTYVPRTVLGPNMVIEGADRHIDEDKMKYGMLVSITYPTKGSTKFIYEPHDFLTNKVTDLTTFIPFDVIVEAELLSGTQAVTDISSPFIINFDQDVSYHIEAETYCTDQPDNMLLLLELVNGEYIEIDDLTIGGGQTDVTGVMILDEGTYKLSATVFLPGKLKCTMECKRLENNNSNEWRNEKIGGLRIKRIENYSAGNELLYFDDYMYRDTEDPSISTGVLVNENISYKSNMVKYMPPTCVPQNIPDDILNCCFQCSYTVVSSSPQVPFGSTNGSHIGYKEVSVFKGGFEPYSLNIIPHGYNPLVPSEPYNNGYGKNGKITKHFTNPEEFPDIYTSMYNPGISKDWKRGLLKREDIYDSTNLLLKKEISEYQLAEPNNYYRTPGVKVTLRETRYSIDDPYEYLIKPYYQESPWKYQTKKTVYEYLDDQELKTQTLYSYNPFDTQLKRVTNIFPDSSAVRKSFY